jgi:hypothetical protein
MRNDRLLALGACAAIAVFVLAFIELFEARVQSGDVYPVFSSLRSDAGGTKAYYDSIGKLAAVTIARGFEPIEADRRRGVTVFLLGIPPQALPTVGAKYQKLADDGNRVVVGLPICGASLDASQAGKQPPVSKLWDLAWECKKRSSGQPEYYALTQVGREWRVIAWEEDGTPIAAERPLGNGSLILLTDSYALTNEALLRDRDTELLAALIGNNGTVLFDEYHLGVVRSQGVVNLARQYRLHSFAAGLLLIAVLFIWRNATSFLPRIAESGDGDEVSGHAASSGLTNLLGRAVSKSDLLTVCVAEWKRSLGRRVPEEEHARAKQVAESAKASKEPAVSYREIAQLLNERRRR